MKKPYHGGSRDASRHLENIGEDPQMPGGNNTSKLNNLTETQNDNGLMSLRDDKTTNILKNYTNLVNRLKQSQKERDVDMDKQYE